MCLRQVGESFCVRNINNCMYAASSAIVWDTYPRPESLISVKKKSKKKVKDKVNKANVVPGKDYLESFEHYYSVKLHEVVQPGKVEPSDLDELEPVIFYFDGSTRVKYPENQEYFEAQELRQLINAKRIKAQPFGPEAYLIIDIDGDEKPINVKASIMLNAVSNTGDVVGGNCMLVPAHLMP